MNQIIMILLISLLILVHEIGHFIVAKMCGVRVTRFGFGMPIGPSRKMFTIGYTDFYIHAFLFGGYVSFADDEPDEEDSENNKEKLPSDSPELYENKTILQKFAIVSAGVIMNVVFAVILVIFCASYYHKLPTSNQNIYIAGFSEKITSDISKKDAIKNDRFYKVNDIEINSLYQLTFFAKNSRLFDNFAQEDLIEKNTIELKKLNPDIKDIIEKDTEIKLPKRLAENPLKVNENVLKGLEKYKKEGIELTKLQIQLRDEVNSKNTYKTKEQISLNDLACALSDTYKPINLTLVRDGNIVNINNIIETKDGLLGVFLRVEDIYTDTTNIKDIVVKSFNYIYTTTTTMLYSLWQLITGKVSMSDMHGVIAIVKVGGDIIASKGMLNGILLTAMISINLAIMNFLPIPALDGGHVMFLIIEKLTGKKPGKELSEKINNFFFILLIILMISICYNDIFALVTKKF